MPRGRLSSQKLICIHDMVKSELFENEGLFVCLFNSWFVRSFRWFVVRSLISFVRCFFFIGFFCSFNSFVRSVRRPSAYKRAHLIFLASRHILLPMVTNELKPHILGESESEQKVCVDIISDLLVTLGRSDVVSKHLENSFYTLYKYSFHDAFHRGIRLMTLVMWLSNYFFLFSRLSSV